MPIGFIISVFFIVARMVGPISLTMILVWWSTPSIWRVKPMPVASTTKWRWPCMLLRHGVCWGNYPRQLCCKLVIVIAHHHDRLVVLVRLLCGCLLLHWILTMLLLWWWIVWPLEHLLASYLHLWDCRCWLVNFLCYWCYGVCYAGGRNIGGFVCVCIVVYFWVLLIA